MLKAELYDKIVKWFYNYIHEQLAWSDCGDFPSEERILEIAKEKADDFIAKTELEKAIGLGPCTAG